MIQSPLNYTGGKYKLLPQILPYFPTQINTFVDLFCGGCNVIIMPINTNELISLIDKKSQYDSIIAQVRELFIDETTHFDLEWRSRYMSSIIPIDKP